MAEKRKKICLLTDRLYYRIPVDIFQGVGKAAVKHGLDLVTITGSILDSADPDKRQSNILYQLADSNDLDGIIIASNVISNETNNSRIKEFCRHFLPVPVISLGVSIEGIPSIIFDNYSGMYRITEHLIQKHGKKKILFICGPENNMDAEERLAAYKAALQDNNIAIDESLILSGDFMENTAAETIRNTDKKAVDDYDSVIGVNDFSARGAFLELLRSGVRIPEQVAIAGFDDIYGMRYLTSALSSVRVPFEEMGEKAVHFLAAYFEGEPIAEVFRLNTEPVIRESCGCIQKHKDGMHGKKSIPDKIQEILKSNRDLSTGQLNNPVDFDFYSELWEARGEDESFTLNRVMFNMNYTRMGQMLSSTLDIPEITDILANHLPLLGITQCYLVLYESPPEFSFPQILPAKSRLVLALRESQRLPLDDDGIQFDTIGLLPDNFKNVMNSENIIIEDLFFRQDQIGYIVFSAEVPGRFYTDIRILVSSALQIAAMFRKNRSNRLHLKQANEQIRLLNEKLSQENLHMHAEMKVAEMIQKALLPENLDSISSDFDISGKMVPAEDVGGDYFDIIRTSRANFWIGIGDVSGHGVTPGLIMMMAQTMYSFAVYNFDLTPKQVLVMMNKILNENIGKRLKQNNFMTFTSLKYCGKGRFIHAGLHLDLIVFRGKTGKSEIIQTEGAWLNLMEDISDATRDSGFIMEEGDILVLYTDGISELFNEKREMFGLERIESAVRTNHMLSAEDIVQRIYSEAMKWSDEKYNDDITLLVLKMEKLLD